MQQSICSTSDSLRLNHNMSSKHPRFPVQRSLLVICTRQQTYLQQGMLVTHIHNVSQSCKLPHNSAWSYTRRMHISSRNTPTYPRVLSQSLYSEKASHFNTLSIKSAVAVVVYAYLSAAVHEALSNMTGSNHSLAACPPKHAKQPAMPALQTSMTDVTHGMEIYCSPRQQGNIPAKESVI